MNRDLEILKMKMPLFSSKIKAEKITEIETVEIKEIEVSESRNLKIKNRFERFKKNLRRKSRSIL